MYESFYGLTRRPFSATPDAACFVAVDTAQHALTELLLCLHGGQGAAVLTAPAGAGKTLLCLKLIAELDETFQTVFLPSANFPTRRSLLQAILYELGHPYIRMGDQELRLELTTAVKQVRASKQGVVLVLDESHLLSDRLFDELRAVTNLLHDGQPLVRLLLSGQLALEEKLASPALASFNQRVACQTTLAPLTRLESAEYLRERIEWAGGRIEDLFSREAVQFIGHAADGLPRCLNQLCDHSLLLGYVAEERPLGVETAREALDDLKQLPLHWNEPVAVATPLEQLQRQAHGETAGAAHTSTDASAPRIDEPLTPSASNSRETTEWGDAESACIEVGAPDPAAASIPASETSHAVTTAVDDRAALARHEPPQPIAAPAAAAGECEFEEELVVDRYAALEAGSPLSEEQAATPAATSETIVGNEIENEIETGSEPALSPAAEARSAATQETAEAVTTETGWDDAHPDQTIDAILPLIDEALCGEPQPQENEPAAFDLPQSSARPSWGVNGPIDEAGTDERSRPVHAGRELEDEIIATVLDSCLETRQTIVRGLERAEAQAPMPPGGTSPADRPPAADPLRKKRQYERLFSQLRRRRGA